MLWCSRLAKLPKNRDNNGGPMRVLVCDDEALARDRLVRMLRDAANCEVVGEADGVADAGLLRPTLRLFAALADEQQREYACCADVSEASGISRPIAQSRAERLRECDGDPVERFGLWRDDCV